MSAGNFSRQADSFLDEGVRGEWFGSGAGPLIIPGTQSCRFLLKNPVGSGKLILIHRYRIHVTTASEYVEILVNPTTNLPVTVIPATNRRIGAPDGVSTLFMDAGVPMTGGTVLPYKIPVEIGQATFTEFMIYPSVVVPPGSSIGTNFTNSTEGESLSTSLLDWKEIPA